MAEGQWASRRGRRLEFLYLLSIVPSPQLCPVPWSRDHRFQKSSCQGRGRLSPDSTQWERGWGFDCLLNRFNLSSSSLPNFSCSFSSNSRSRCCLSFLVDSDINFVGCELSSTWDLVFFIFLCLSLEAHVFQYSSICFFCCF